MAKPRSTTPTPEHKPAVKHLNPYEGYRVSPLIRGKRFLYRGDELDANQLTQKQLATLAADPKFKHITKTQG